ncbi:TOMM precursor leader peptide-binding protein [Dactylosporangium sp. CA-092794]|uniref:TOMM precursor leader peptide-binding protein n=1 Tax=Dactylosporangium sp. CA-092794 TaxID=3239929 RepID=UPI003D8D4C34
MYASTEHLPDPAGTVAEYLSERFAGLALPVTADVGHLGLRDNLAPSAPAPARTAAVPVRVYGRTVYIGPFGTRPCARCFERRWQELRPAEERHAMHRGTAGGAGAIPPLPTALERVWQVVRHLVSSPPAAPDAAAVYEVGLDSAAVRRHTLLADSLCPACATPRPDTPAGAALKPAPRPKPAPDRHRLRSVDEYLLDGYVDPACGALGTSAMRAYQLGATAPVSGRFQVQSKYNLHDVWWSGHAGSYAASERLGILEGLERYAGQQPRARTVDVFDSYANLAGQALDPRDCGVYRPEFYAGRAHYRPFDEELPMHWVWGWSLRDERPLLVPEQLVYYLDRRPGHDNFVQECSNGCASGSCPEEAVLHGLLELVERDAFLLAWFSAQTLPEIDIRSVRSPDVQFMHERVGLLGYDVRLFDLRADLPVPAVLAVGVRREPGIGMLCFAAGSGLEPEEAIRAALCETASYVAGFPERVAASVDDARAMAADYRRVTELPHHALLYGLPEMAAHAAFLFDDPPLATVDDLYAGWRRDRPVTDDLTDDLRMLVDQVVRLGSDVIVVDQTCPEQHRAGVHTTAVIAPGLLPIDFGWARQRAPHHPRLLARLAGRSPHPHPHPFP